VSAEEGLFNPLSDDISSLVSDVTDKYLGFRIISLAELIVVVTGYENQSTLMFDHN
jgi:hypothetical protein